LAAGLGLVGRPVGASEHGFAVPAHLGESGAGGDDQESSNAMASGTGGGRVGEGTWRDDEAVLRRVEVSSRVL
jgi:hypothetical protein